MRVTKLEHAALVVEQSGKHLVIDPGSFTTPIAALDDLVAIVVTHEHPDHWTGEQLGMLRAAAPDVPIFGSAGIAAAAEGFDVQVVNPGDTVVVEPFTLRFFGGVHAVIHESIAVVDNVGVLVNDLLYYPGDSYAVPEGVDVALLAAPLGAPWLKIGDAMDFVLAVKPSKAFGTHDMTVSDIGRPMHRDRLKWATEQNGGEFLALDPGDHVDL